MGSLQREDFKSEAELIAAGGAKSQLLNDTEIYVTAKGINETLDDAIILGKIGGGGSGGINYITNSDIASNVNGYLAYADAAGIMPVDGTGGSPTITITRNTTTPLRGTGDAKIAKPASNCQGQGISYDFPIDLADATQPAKVSFSYRASANFSFANEDLRIWIYDRDASVLIPVTPYQMDGSGKFVGEFQFNASTSNNYRLIFHIATTNANAWDFYIDDVKVGPSSEQAFVLLQDKQYTLTVTGSSWTTGHAVGIPYKTKDGTWRLRFNIMGSYGSPISNGSINISGITTTSAVSRQAVTLYPGGYYGYAYADTSNNQLWWGASASINDIRLSGDIELASMPTWAVDFYPVQLSDGAETRVVTCSYRGVPTGTLNGSFNTMTFPTKTKDTHSMYSSGISTVKIAGDYDLSMFTQINGTFTVGSSMVAGEICINGVALYEKYITASRTSSCTFEFVQLGIPLNVNDTVEIKMYCDATGPSYENTAARHAFALVKETGPATITKSQVVNCRYTGNAGQSLSGSEIIVVCPTKAWDTHGMYNPSTGVIRLPCAGKFKINYSAFTGQAGTGSNEYLEVYVKTGSVAGAGTYLDQADWKAYGSGASPCPVKSSITVSGFTEDTFTIQAVSTLGASRSLNSNASLTWIEINKVD